MYCKYTRTFILIKSAFGASIISYQASCRKSTRPIRANFVLLHSAQQQAFHRVYTMCSVQPAQHFHSLVQTQNRSLLRHHRLKNKRRNISKLNLTNGGVNLPQSSSRCLLLRSPEIEPWTFERINTRRLAVPVISG